MSRDEGTNPTRRGRHVARAHVPPGPLRELKDLLYEAYVEAGEPTLDEIVKGIRLDFGLSRKAARDTVRRCISSPDLPAQQLVAVSVITVLARLAAWDVQDMKRRVLDLWVRARMLRPPGRPIAEFSDPFLLEVHRPIEVGEEEGGAGLPVLPPYVERPHDARLRAIVGEAAAGQSRTAVLVGGSSTGKTRACWEALHLLPEEWRLWTAENPSRALEELDSVVPRTVIWWDETQKPCLSTAADPAAEEFADRLRQLLHDPVRAPVLVLGTMWEATWSALTTEPAEWNQDRHKRARALLTSCVAIHVPPAFTSEQDLAVLRERASEDPRLARALADAQDGEVTQYLAGTPVLVARYRGAPPEAKALIDAAMDIRRLGHGLALPLPLLEAAAATYLSPRQWQRLARCPDWLQRALEHAEADCCGVPGPLTPVPPLPGEPRPAVPSYRLADFLEQLGRRERDTKPTPARLWDVLVGFAAREELPALARSAEDRGLLRTAMRLYSAAALAGDSRAYCAAGRLLKRADRVDEAFAWFKRAVAAGDALALLPVGEMLIEAGRDDELRELLISALRSDDELVREFAARDLTDVGESHYWNNRHETAVEWLRPAADADHAAARWHLAHVARESGAVEQAIEGYQGIAERGSAFASDATSRAIALLKEKGRTQEALAWVCRLAESGDHAAMSLAAGTLEAEGQVEESLRWYAAAARAETHFSLKQAVWAFLRADRAEEALALMEDCASAGATHVLPFAAGVLWHELSRAEEALALYERSARLGNTYAMGCAAANLLKAGRIEEALTWYERAAKARDWKVMSDAGARLWEAGRREAALSWFRRAALAGHEDALTEGASRLWATGDAEAARAWWLSHAESGNPRAMKITADVLRDAGRIEEALAWYERAVEAGNTHALRSAGGMLRQAGRVEEALAWYQRAAAAGDEVSLQRVVRLLRRTGRAQAAIDWLRQLEQEGHDSARFHLWNVLEATSSQEGLPALQKRAKEGDTRAARAAVRLLEAASRYEEALALCQGGQLTASLEEWQRALRLLERTGRKGEALRLRRYGWEPDGTVARPWDAPSPQVTSESRS
ncbi:tetratricopeptide repeat protein [Streptomyces himalayensis]|uniref:Sel1 repeat family protein n=1 Tax=Streptomyces himalayensis subsp. himalayensis TaxID=2756131 RepID=A0A7W0DIB4_9ACTN|nr:sel1 repeat family protein [Streptomyces himalayensis]MBA2945315.1 sel1 repeat family protein [Streptomyces himalayensis subsp. himalayensis]